MKLPEFPFTVTDWSAVEPVKYAGETGEATWRTMMMGDIRIRIVEYSPGYLADHWCDRGHIFYVLEGETENELSDGRKFTLGPGMSYEVSSDIGAAHRTYTRTGAKVFIVD